MSLLSEFHASEGSVKRNPGGDDFAGFSQEIRMERWIATRGAAGVKKNPPAPDDDDAVPLDDLYLAGQELGLSGLDLERFVEGAGTWW